MDPRLVGIPYEWGGRGLEGCDCWGAVCLYFRSEFGIELPAMSDQQPANHADKAQIATMIRRGAYTDWDAVPLSDVTHGDVLLLDGGTGVAVVIADPRYMLLSLPELGTVTQRTTGLRWARKIDSAHRHRELRT